MAALFGVLGFAFADSIARNMGLAPSGKGFWNSAAYWGLTSAIAIGGAAIGYYAGAAITKAAAGYLSQNPHYIIKVANQCRPLFVTIMYLLGLDPFRYMPDASKFTALAQALNGLTLSQKWAQSFCEAAQRFGRKIFFDEAHNGYGYHIHLCGKYGQKLEKIHIVITEYVWEYLKEIFG